MFQSLQRVNSKGLYLGQERTKIIIASDITAGSGCYGSAGEPFLLELLGLCSHNGLGPSASGAVKWHPARPVGLGPVLPHHLSAPVEKSQLGAE